MKETITELIVLIHVFTSFGSFLVLLFSFAVRNHLKLHKRSGKVFKVLYTLMLITSFAISFFIFSLNHPMVKATLLVQTLYAAGLFQRALSSIKGPKTWKSRERITDIGLLVSGVLSIVLFIAGIFYGNNVAILGGLLFLGFTMADHFLLRKRNLLMIHIHGMLIGGSLLIFNGTSFFGVRQIFYANDFVSFYRMSLSILPMIGLYLFCFYIARFISRLRMSNIKA